MKKQSVQNCVVLFDIDGTLVASDRRRPAPGVVAMNAAAKLITGLDGLSESVQFAGRTDRQIARDLLFAGGNSSVSGTEIDRLIAAYVETLALVVDENPYRPIGNVRNAVGALREAGCVIGLGTGNVLAGARIKLNNAGILDCFDLRLGGYGDDADTRDEVLRIGASRCDASAEKTVVVIGDTTHDVGAAIAIGAICIAVTTGPCDESTLRNAGATSVVRGLDTDIVCLLDTCLC